MLPDARQRVSSGSRNPAVNAQHRFDHAALAAVAVLDRHAQGIDPHDRAATHELDAALSQAGVRRSDVTCASQLRADHMVGGDEADRGTVGREQLGNPDGNRAADRVPDDDRARKRLGDVPLGGEDLGGCRDGRPRGHLEAPPAGARAGAVHDRPLVAVDLLEGRLMAVTIRTPQRRHSDSSQSTSAARRSLPGARAATRTIPPRLWSRSMSVTSWPAAAATRAHSRPAGPPPTTRTLDFCPAATSPVRAGTPRARRAHRARFKGRVDERVGRLMARTWLTDAGDDEVAHVAHSTCLVA